MFVIVYTMPLKPKTHLSRLKRIGKTDLASKQYEMKRMKDPKLRGNKKIRSSTRWQKVRKLFIQSHPLCFDPFGNHELMGVAQITEEIHHIKGLYDYKDLAFDMDNLAALCRWCHARIEASERSGKPTQHFFDKTLD